jgi:hypothetical protein
MGTSGTDKFREYRDPDKGAPEKKETPARPVGGPEVTRLVALRKEVIGARSLLPTYR